MALTDDEIKAYLAEPPAGTRAAFDSYWLWLHSTDRDDAGITGKYLFFCEDPRVLIAIAADEIANRGFALAKVNSRILGTGTEHVLCLYHCDDSQKFNLKDRYRYTKGVNYRWWKLDADTHAGKYSGEFLNTLPAPAVGLLTAQEYPARPCATNIEQSADGETWEWDCWCGAANDDYASAGGAKIAATRHRESNGQHRILGAGYDDKTGWDWDCICGQGKRGLETLEDTEDSAEQHLIEVGVIPAAE